MGTYSAEDEFQVTGLRREGNRFTAHIRYIRAVPEGKNDRSAYFQADLPADLPPGRYYALVQLAEYLREGGRIIFAPKEKIRAHGYLTCMFDVPPKDNDPAVQIDRQLPGSGLSMAEAAGEGFHAIAVCETTGKASFNFEGGGQYRTWPKVKVIEVLTGKLRPGQELELQYVWKDTPSRHERSLATDEKAIWLIRKGESSGKTFYTGARALTDTLQNRQKAKTFVAESTAIQPAGRLN